MSFDQDYVNKLAYLARIGIKAEDNFATHLVDDLNKIISLVDQINEIDTSDIEPMAHPLQNSQRLRPDEITEENVKTKMQNLVKPEQVENGLYLVPKVIE